MFSKSLGFIGGGRATKIIIKGFSNSGIPIDKVVISDINLALLEKLKSEFPEISISHNDNKIPAKQDIIFISLHPPIMIEQLKIIKKELKENSILISLAPKLTIKCISEMLGGFYRIIRMNPNAPTIINDGFNPICFSEHIPLSEKNELMNLFLKLGKCPEVAEEKIEAFAVITAMGPTYFWFQLYELKSIAESFGIANDEIRNGITSMLTGAVETMFSSGLKPDEVMNLVPVRPLLEEEERIKEAYRVKLADIYNKIKPT